MEPQPILSFKARIGIQCVLKCFKSCWFLIFIVFLSSFPVFAQSTPDETEKQIFEEGRRRLDLGDLDGAITSFQDILLVNPRHTPSHLILGLIYGRKGQLNTAIESLKQAIEIDPNLLAGYLLLGQMYTRKNLPDQAKSAYERVIAIQPAYAGGYTLLGQIYQQEGDEVKAVELYRVAVSLKEDSPEKKQAQAALETLKKKAGITFEQGKRRLQQGAIDQAIMLFEKVRILDPGNIQVLFKLGRIYIQKGQLEKGIVFFKQALEKDAKFFKARLFLGQAYEGQGKISEAIIEYRTILSQVPDPQQNEAVLARKKLSQTGETPEIGKMVQSLLQEGARLLALDDLEGAKAEFLAVLTFLPKQVLVHYHLGQIDLRQNAPLEAEKKFKTAIAIAADHFPSYYALGDLYEKRNDNAAAIEIYEQLLRVRHADDRAKIRLGILFEKENNIKKALRLYHQVADAQSNGNLAARDFAQSRIDLYEKKLKLSLTDTAISYDSNRAQSENPESEVSSSMTLAATYFFKKLERYRIPMKFNLNTRFLHKSQIYFLNTGLSLSYARSFLNYNVLADYNLGVGSMFGSDVENGRSFLSHVYTGEISRQGKIPTALTLRGSYQDLAVFSNPVFSSKRTTGTGILSQNFSVGKTDLGTLHLSYRYMDNAVVANDQTRREQTFSLDYSRKFGKKLTLKTGFSRTEQNFLNEDTLALSQGESKKRHNTLSSANLGFSYRLQKGFTLFASYTRIKNKSNLPVPGDLSVQDINNGQVTSLGSYDQNLISFGMTGTADLKTFYPQWHRLGKQLTIGLTTGYYRPALTELNDVLRNPKTVIVQDPNHLLPTNPEFRSEARNIQMKEIKGGPSLGIEMEWEISPRNGLVFSVSEWRNSTVRTDIVPMILSPGEPSISVPRSARYNLIINQVFLSWRYSLINQPTRGRLFFDLGLIGGSFTNLTADALVKVEDNPVGDPFASLGSFEARGRSFTTRVGLGGAVFIRPWLSLGLSANYVWGTVTRLKIARDFPSSFGLISEGLPGVANSDCFPRLGDRTGGDTLTVNACQNDQVTDPTQAPQVLKLKLNGLEGRAALRFHFGKGKPGRTAFEKFMNWGDQEEVEDREEQTFWNKVGLWGKGKTKPGRAGLSFDGTLKNETAYRVNKPVTFTKTLNLMRLNARYTASSKFFITARGRAFYDAITDFIDPDTVSPRRFENTILTQLPRNPTPEEIAEVDVENSRNVEINQDGIDLRELYIDAQFKNFDLRIGKQIVRWGVVPGARVTDEINPFDFGEFILREVEDRFIPLMMARADFFPGDARFELIWITEAAPHKPAPAGSEFEQFQILDGFIPPDSFLDSSLNFDFKAIENTEIAARLVHNWGGWEIGFTAFYTWDDFPASFRRIEGDAAGGFSNAPEVIFTPRMNRITTIGTTLSKSFGRIVLNAEFAYTFGKLFGTLLDIKVAAASNLTANVDNDISPVLGELERDFLKYAAGLDFALFGAEMSMQFLQQYIPNWNSVILQDKIDTVLSHFMRKTFMHERLVGRMLTLYFLSEEDILLRPALETRLTDKVKTVVGADIFIGDRGEEVGQFDFIGFFKDSNRIFLEIVYSF